MTALSDWLNHLPNLEAYRIPQRLRVAHKAVVLYREFVLFKILINYSGVCQQFFILNPIDSVVLNYKLFESWSRSSS